MKAKVIGYWAATAIVAFVMLTGGVVDMLHPKEAVEGMTKLGYPLYFMTILGFWKVLCALALLAPRFPRLKEWAYAGAFFDLSGAFASHAFVHEWNHLWAPILFTLVLAASWALRPASRTLGVLSLAPTVE